MLYFFLAVCMAFFMSFSSFSFIPLVVCVISGICVACACSFVNCMFAVCSM